MRQLPEQCESCKRQIVTLETRVLPDGTRKRGAEMTFRESVEGGSGAASAPMRDEPHKTPYLRFGDVETPILGPAVEIVGNARGLLQLRRQIDRALGDADRYPLDEALYRDEDEQEHQVVVRRAKSRGEMRPPAPKPQGTPERLPWAEVTRRQEMERREKERGG